MAHNHTPEQKAIIAYAAANNHSFIIDAKAGSGKSTTLIDVIGVLKGSTTLQAFNKSIATELDGKANKSLPPEKLFDLSITTVHAHGLSAFRRANRRPKVEGGKMNFILKDILAADGEDDRDSLINKNRAAIKNLAGYAKAAGFGLSSMAENFPAIEDIAAWEDLAEHYNVEESLTGEGISMQTIIRYAIKLLKMSNARENMIDFDDMIYLPLLWNLPLPTYDNVLLDEAQDINATRREMAFRSMKPTGRIIAVGDPNQAIYGFTGASVDSLSRIRDRIDRTSTYKCEVFPLSVCWRCAKNIITSAQIQVPGIMAAPNAPDGQVLTMHFGDDAANESIFNTIKPGAAILCRLNKPNVTMALELLKREKHCKIEGRDLGRKLLFYAQSSTDGYSHIKLDELKHELHVYKQTQINMLLKKDKTSAAALLEDEIDCALLLLDRCLVKGERTWEQFKRFVEGLFADDIPAGNIITLSSIHKAKGREWPVVFILGFDDYMPFFRAVMDWELEQEDNLTYVAKTRAEQALVMLNGAKSWIDNRKEA